MYTVIWTHNYFETSSTCLTADGAVTQVARATLATHDRVLVTALSSHPRLILWHKLGVKCRWILLTLRRCVGWETLAFADNDIVATHLYFKVENLIDKKVTSVYKRNIDTLYRDKNNGFQTKAWLNLYNF